MHNGERQAYQAQGGELGNADAASQFLGSDGINSAEVHAGRKGNAEQVSSEAGEDLSRAIGNIDNYAAKPIKDVQETKDEAHTQAEIIDITDFLKKFQEADDPSEKSRLKGEMDKWNSQRKAA